MELKSFISLSNHDGIWMLAQTPWEIHSSSFDQKLHELFNEHIRAGGRNGAIWNKEHGPASIVLPHFEGLKTDLIYYYPAGLYFNYAIDQIHYLPGFEYLSVFTRQSMLAVGLDTMHGFLILKVARDQ